MKNTTPFEIATKFTAVALGLFLISIIVGFILDSEVPMIFASFLSFCGLFSMALTAFNPR